MIIITAVTLMTLLESTTAVCHACFNNICYTKHKLFEAEQLSGQIAIDRMDNLLHLHYKDMKSTDYTAVVDINFENLKMYTLPIPYSFARAIDHSSGVVYFSSTRGIYTYDPVTKITAPYGLFTSQIWHMQYKGKLYYTKYQEKGLFYIENNRTYCIEPLSDYVIDDFVIDKYNDIYFTSDYLVYRLRKNEPRAEIFSSVLYSLTTDTYDSVYFVETNARSLFRLDDSTDTLTELGIFEEGTLVFRMTFDKLNRIVYCDATDDKVYLLVPNYAHCTLTFKHKKLRY